MKKSKIIEVVLSVDLIASEDTVLPSQVHQPNDLRITPYVSFKKVGTKLKRTVNFRVAFETDNKNRRKQPFRNILNESSLTDPIFPDNWKHGQHYENDIVDDVDKYH